MIAFNKPHFQFVPLPFFRVKTLPLSPLQEGLLLAGLAWLMRFLFWLFNGALVLPDGYDRYLPIGQVIFQVWQGSPYDTPGYPLFIGLAFGLDGKAISLPLMQHLLSTATVVFTWACARRLGMGNGAFWLGLIMALHPGSILFSNAVLSETLFTFWVTTAFFLTLQGKQILIWPRALAVGVVLGLAAITRANGVLLVAVMGLVIFCNGRKWVSWGSLTVFALGGLFPILTWMTVNHQLTGRFNIAKGGSWQLLQSIAYFEWLDPETLPEGDRDNYKDWTSLTEFRARSTDSGDGRWSNQAMDQMVAENIRNQPFQYLVSIPKAMLLPRAFVKDVTRMATSPEKWQQQGTIARSAGYGNFYRPLNTTNPYNLLYSLLRRLWIFSGKYTLLLLVCIPALWLAWREKNAGLLMAASLPFSQFLALTLMLNPIERYYFPFEPLLLISFAAVVSAWWRRKKGGHQKPGE